MKKNISPQEYRIQNIELKVEQLRKQERQIWIQVLAVVLIVVNILIALTLE